MKIAHLSDLHLLALEGVPARRFLNKRATGWVNLRLKRGSVHRRVYVEAIAREIRRSDFDHVVITGDLTNLALESEFQLARDLLERDLGLPPDRVTIVPGNHDVYTRGAMRSRRFERYFAPFLASDLPDLAVDVGGARFPVVKLRGPAAFVALSSAVPRLPLVAAGELGEAQVQSLARILDHPEVQRRTPVLVLHHPPAHPWSRLKEHLEGLRDAEALLSVLGHLSRGIVLHGHLHRRIQRSVATLAGELRQVGATSASLQHEERDRMAGFNVYELSDRGLEAVQAVVYEPGSGAFGTASVPEGAGPPAESAAGRRRFS
jgi:3',5'-cyclic AMP phosphodiesterase CpdA